MSYYKVPTHIPDLGKVISHPGYGWKLCPYSNQYRDEYAYPEGYIYGFDANNNPLRYTGVVVVGTTTNSDLQEIGYASYPCSDHTTTSGYMEYSSNPPGWICRDPNCYFSTTVEPDKCYTES